MDPTRSTIRLPFLNKLTIELFIALLVLFAQMQAVPITTGKNKGRALKLTFENISFDDNNLTIENIYVSTNVTDNRLSDRKPFSLYGKMKQAFGSLNLFGQQATTRIVSTTIPSTTTTTPTPPEVIKHQSQVNVEINFPPNILEMILNILTEASDPDFTKKRNEEGGQDGGVEMGTKSPLIDLHA